MAMHDERSSRETSEGVIDSPSQIESQRLQASFSSEEEMFESMERLRSQNTTEVSGIVIDTETGFELHYTVGDSDIMSVLPSTSPLAVFRSWHSHPTSPNLDEFKLEDLEPHLLAVPQIADAARELLRIIPEIDEQVPSKISFLDLYNFAFHQRAGDIVSLPQGQIIEIRMEEAEDSSPVFLFAERCRQQSAELEAEARQRVVDEDRDLLMVELTFRMYLGAAQNFRSLLESVGASRFSQDNWLNVLEKSGVPYRIAEVGGEGLTT